jgi:hypothetical protein
MILFAYACLAIAVTAYLRGSIYPIPQRLESLARVLGVVAGAAFALIGFLLLGNDGATIVGTTLLLLLALGGIVYASGLVRWRASDGFVLRRTGWFLVVAALAFPSTLTLLMPLASLLVLTLRSTPGPHRVAQVSPPLGR